MRLARSMTLDRDTGRIVIDGVEFPFHTHADGPEIESGGPDGPVTTVWLGIQVYGVVTLSAGGHTGVIDPELGDVGEWARNLVRAGLSERLPWIKL